MDDDLLHDEKFRSIAAQIRKGEKPTSVSVRELMSWFGVQRRGIYVVQMIREALREAGLKTEPDFEGIWIDGGVSFVNDDSNKGEVELSEGSSSFRGFASTAGVQSDPANRIAKLEAANTAPVSVKPNDSISVAVTTMLSHNFSQLPVTVNERDVKGVVTWASIGSRLALRSGDVREVRECMEEPGVVSVNTSLFEAMESILRYGYVLVQDETKKITGIVTTHDLSQQFRQLSEPFLLLGEIEQHVRRLVERGSFPMDKLKECRDPSDGLRNVTKVANLSMGELVRLLQNESNWAQIGLSIDRRVFIKDLDEVRRIRNDVMHFDPDPIEARDVETLRVFAQFLTRLPKLIG